METKAREYYLECSNVNNPDTFVGDVYLTVRSDTSIHVIEYSAYEKLQKRVEELEASVQGARAHAEVMEHKATRVNAMLREEYAENKKLRDALGTLSFEVKYYLDNLNAAWGYSEKQIQLKHAAEKAFGELNG